MTDRPTDLQTDKQTKTPVYKNSKPGALKTRKHFVYAVQKWLILFKNNNRLQNAIMSPLGKARVNMS